MAEETIEITVMLPSMDDFLKIYPRFKKLVNGQGRELFDAIMRPEVFLNARVLADFGFPSVQAVAEQCQEIINRSSELSPTDGLVKQYIGSLICALMKENGYTTSDKKKSVRHELFSVGELYKRKPISRLEAVQSGGSRLDLCSG